MTDTEDKQARAEAINRALDEMDAVDREQDAQDDAELTQKAEQALSKHRTAQQT